MTPELFISLIKNGMEKSGISLREVARFVEVDPSFLSKILAGKRSPPSDEKILKKLAEVLDLDPLRLIVSTGTIPSEWQSAFESQDFLDELSRTHASLKRVSLKNTHRLGLVTHHKSKELSEDLL